MQSFNYKVYTDIYFLKLLAHVDIYLINYFFVFLPHGTNIFNNQVTLL